MVNNSKIERFDQMAAPPVQGKFYLVWCVTGKWYGKLADWPVWGPKHEDGKFLDFHAPHYHLNRYFVDDYRSTAAPLADRYDGFGYNENDPLPAPVLRRKRCVTDTPEPFPDWLAHRESSWTAMGKIFAGHQCKRGIGWICPHKGFDLGPIAPGAGGHIRCPLHGLLIHAGTGRVTSKGSRGRAPHQETANAR